MILFFSIALNRGNANVQFLSCCVCAYVVNGLKGKLSKQLSDVPAYDEWYRIFESSIKPSS